MIKKEETLDLQGHLSSDVRNDMFCSKPQREN